MLYLNLEYQLLLVISLISSFYIFFNSLTIKYQSSNLRAFGVSFVLPLLLTSASFFVATYNKATSSAMLFLGHIFLVLICTIIALYPQNHRSITFFYILPFLLIIASLFIAYSPLYNSLFSLFCFIALALVVLNLALIIYTMLQTEKDHILVYVGLFMMASAIGIWLLSKELNMEIVLISALGYIVLVMYIHKHSTSLLLKEHKENKEALSRMNTSIHTEVIRRVEEIERSNRKLLEISKTDSMTGLYVKSAVIKNLTSLIERNPPGGISLLMFDIDHFKQINDNLGHQIGDKCIKSIASLAKTSFRSDDILGRYGGDEFIVILPGTAAIKAYIIADRFRQSIQSKTSPQITISVGISSFPADGNSSESIIEAADKALYISKQKGRNQVTIFPTQKPKD